ncbi:MAG: helix-turn-helix domain-containing protein [Rhodoglobus sp.]
MIPNWVIRDGLLSPNELAVYLVLLSHRDHTTGEAYPGFGTIAKESQVSRSTVKRLIPDLESMGLITVKRRKREGGKNEVNLYTVAKFARARPVGNFALNRAETQREPNGLQHPRFTENPPRATVNLGGRSTVNPEEEPLTTRTNEQAVRSELTSGREFSFDVISISATNKQLTLLSDLHILFGSGAPEQALKQDWAHLTQTAAAERIQAYYKYMPRADDYQGPWPGDPAYDDLTPEGQQWADTGFSIDEIERAKL